MTTTSNRCSPEVRARAVRMVLNHQADYASQWAAMQSIAPKFGCAAETLRKWVRREESDTGQRPGPTSDQLGRLKELERENRERRQDLVSEGIDIAFRLGSMPDSTVLARRLTEAARLLVAAPHYLRGRPSISAPEELRAHSLIVGPGVVPPTLEFRQGDRRVSVRAEGRITCAANEGATALARAGLGITVSSLWGVSRELETGALIVVLPDWTLPQVELHAVSPPGRAPGPAARALADFVARTITKPSMLSGLVKASVPPSSPARRTGCSSCSAAWA
jgi:transposase-like protein